LADFAVVPLALRAWAPNKGRREPKTSVPTDIEKGAASSAPTVDVFTVTVKDAV
jgi:hypothetical protein